MLIHTTKPYYIFKNWKKLDKKNFKKNFKYKDKNSRV